MEHILSTHENSAAKHCVTSHADGICPVIDLRLLGVLIFRTFPCMTLCCVSLVEVVEVYHFRLGIWTWQALTRLCALRFAFVLQIFYDYLVCLERLLKMFE